MSRSASNIFWRWIGQGSGGRPGLLGASRDDASRSLCAGKPCTGLRLLACLLALPNWVLQILHSSLCLTGATILCVAHKEDARRGVAHNGGGGARRNNTPDPNIFKARTDGGHGAELLVDKGLELHAAGVPRLRLVIQAPGQVAPLLLRHLYETQVYCV